MKAILFAAIALYSSFAGAQDAASMQAGKAFAQSIAPTSATQLVNPTGVMAANGGNLPAAWAGGATAAPTSTPAQLGVFSTPVTGTTAMTQAQSMGLSAFGDSALNRCATYVPTGNVADDQECAAVNFMSKRCLTPTTANTGVLNKVGMNQAVVPGCQGTFGGDQRQFNYKDQMVETDFIFQNTNDAQTNAQANVGGANVCTQQTAVTTPAQFATNQCQTSKLTQQVACSKSISAHVITTPAAPIPASSCPGGVMVGQYCQYAADGSIPPPIYQCPPTHALVGNQCVQTITTAPNASMVCTGNAQLVGYNCVETNTISAAVIEKNFTCALGQALVGNTCQTTVQPLIQGTLFGYRCTNQNFANNFPVLTNFFPQDLAPGTSMVVPTNNGIMSGNASFLSVDASGLCTIDVTDTVPWGAGGWSWQHMSDVWQGSPLYNPSTCPPGMSNNSSNCIAPATTVGTIGTPPCAYNQAFVNGACIAKAITRATTTNSSYSCLDGSAPNAGFCNYSSVSYFVDNACANLESSAGVTLANP